MDFSQLRVFSSVAKHSSFIKASEECFMSPTAISYHIKKIEEQLGVQLLIRDTHSVSLTYAGTIFLEYAEKIMQQYGYMLKDIRSINQACDNLIRIAYSGDWDKIVIPKIISRFHNSFPNTTVSLNRVPSHNLVPLLINDEADISFLTPFNYDVDPRVSTITIDSSLTCLAVNKENPLAGKKEVSIDDLNDQTFIVLTPDEDYALESENIKRFWEKIDYKPSKEQIIIVNDTEQCLLLLESNIGVSFLPKTMRRCCSSQIRFLKVKDRNLSSALRLSYITNKRAELEGFLQVVQDYIEER